MARRPPNAATRSPHNASEAGDPGSGSSEDERPSEGNLGPRTWKRSTPGKLTPEVLGRICDRLAEATPYAHACLLEGISPQALDQMRAKHPDVAFMVDQARAMGADNLRLEFRRGAQTGLKTYQGFGWMLERLYPKDFAPPSQKQEITGKDGGPVETAGGLQITITDAKRIIRERRAKGDK